MSSEDVPQQIEQMEIAQNQEKTKMTVADEAQATVSNEENADAAVTVNQTNFVTPDDDLHDIHPYRDRHFNEEKIPNLLVNVLKQLKPGVDLTRVTLPTFILEPRSLLEKWGDFVAFPLDVFCAANEPDKDRRFLFTCAWFMSGFSLLPKHVRKPYNPILGEMFRFYLDHEAHPFPQAHPHDAEYDMSQIAGVKHNPTVYIAEQVSHHPPISAFYISNRKAGFVAEGWVYTRSKFTGNSAGSIMEGRARLHLLKFGDVYECTFPSAFMRNVIVGNYHMEITGSMDCCCVEQNLRAHLEFKPKPILGGKKGNLRGSLKRDGRVLYNIDGNYLDKTYASKPSAPKDKIVLSDSANVNAWTAKTVGRVANLEPNESRRLWSGVTRALNACPADYDAATVDKTRLEDEQRAAAAERQKTNSAWVPKLFSEGAWESSSDGLSAPCRADWTYIHRDVSPYTEGDDGDAALATAAIIDRQRV
ncbi:Oxysterol-binding protein [Carpediemonas membranifera]|uniref:Oxysterol-binding protein n=1 Tax=Carpediemonas membranifera TaxID=201153 RepID=A0A8J6E1Z1_9EUKA|nr:Oxysterol-binding protein [Carpediemonas membranifera]|eukprot:KAG9396969.1 Oxysterol-binding protein [Carpediemonas membranifera]